MQPQRSKEIREFYHEGLYQPLESPQFKDLKVTQPCFERWEMIKPHLGEPTQMLDLGCHTGWFCRAFSREGWRTIGIDKGRFEIEVARDMREYDGQMGPIYMHGDFIKSPALLNAGLAESKVVLCLSVLMYMFDDVEAGWAVLDKISQSCEMMFVDFGGMYADRLPFNERSFPQLIQTFTQFKACQLLGQTHVESRPFYLLTT